MAAKTKKAKAIKVKKVDEFDPSIDDGLDGLNSDDGLGENTVDSPVDAADELEGSPKDGLIVPKAISTSGIPVLGQNQKYFEAPDGFICVGPAEAVSVPDPRDKNREIRPQRGASFNFRK